VDLKMKSLMKNKSFEIAYPFEQNPKISGKNPSFFKTMLEKFLKSAIFISWKSMSVKKAFLFRCSGSQALLQIVKKQ
jgi:hypothetical protein